MVSLCSPEPLARGSGSSKARRNGWPGSLDGRRRKRVLVKIFGEESGTGAVHTREL
jgi:hypothetical protein